MPFEVFDETDWQWFDVFSPAVPRQNSEYEEINRLLGWLSIKSAA
jgi:hypothetical protein